MDQLTQSYLRWIRQGLDELIQQARMALEAFVGEADAGGSAPAGAGQPETAGRLDDCLNLLRQVHASLQMVQIYGLGLLLEETLLLGQALQAGKVVKVNEALESMMAAMILLGDRLDRIQQGEDDTPVAMLSMLNDLRTCRDATLLTGLSLFSGDLDQQITRLYAEPGSFNPLMPRIAEKLRASFHKGLLHWLRHPESKDGLVLVQAVLDKFVDYAAAHPTKAFFGALAALAQSLASNGLEAGVTVKRLMSRVDREIKLLTEGGEEAFVQDPEPELFKNILYYVANSSSEDPRVQATLAQFELKSLHGFKPGTQALAGVNHELLAAVSDALREDLLHIKDSLDDYLKAEARDIQMLAPQYKDMVRLADTVGMLGQGGQRLELKQQAERLADWIAKAHAPLESELMDLASSVLNVELAIDQLSKFQGGTLTEQSLPVFSRDELMVVTLRESLIEMAHIKEQLGLYLEHPTNGLAPTIQGRFGMVLGALGILQLTEPAAMLTLVARYVSERLSGAGLPPMSELVILADLLVSIEYLMESMSQELGLEAQILAFARVAQTALEASWCQTASQDALAQTSGPESTQSEETALAPLEASPSIAPLADPLSAPELTMRESLVSSGTPQPGQASAGLQVEVGVAPEPVEPLELLESVPEIIETAPAPESEPELDRASGLVLVEPEEPLSEVRQEPESVELEYPELAEGLTEESPEPLELLESVPEIIEIVPAPAPEPELDRASGLILVEPLEREAAEPDSLSPRGLSTAPEQSILEIEPEQLLGAPDLEPALGSALSSVSESFSPAPSAPAPAPSPAAVAGVNEDEVDSEILDIFLEEAEEEKDAILEQLPMWLADPTENAALVRVRRAFHTLKGSGRLVGAQILGDFAWSVENLLNKVLEGTVKPGGVLDETLGEVLDILPSIIERERARTPHPIEHYQALSAKANALAAGKPLPSGGPLPGPSPVSSPVSSPALPTSTTRLETPDFLPFDESKALADELHPVEHEDALGKQDSLLYTTWGGEDHDTLVIESRLVAEMDQALMGDASVLIRLDESLYGIFAPECRKQLEALSRFSTAIAKQSTGVDPGLVQVLYDLAASAKMAEIEPIAKLAKAAERCFALMQTFGLAPSAQDVSLLSRVLNELSALFAIVNVSGATMPDWRPLLVELESRLVQLEVETSAADSSFKSASMEARVEPWRRSEQDTLMISEDPFLEAMGMTVNHSESTSTASHLAQGAGDSAPSSYIPMPGAGSVDELEDFVAEDQELLEIFLEEAKDLGEKMDIALQAWLDNADDKAAMDQLKRVLHTLKGASRLAGVLQIGDLSHAYESFFIAIEHGSLAHSGQIDQIARQVGDFLLWQIESLDSSGKIPSSRGWLDTLGAAQRGEFSGQGRPIPLGTDSKILSNQGAPWPETQESLAELTPKGLDVGPVWPDVPESLAPGDGPSTLDIQVLDTTGPDARQDPTEVLSLEDELKALEGLDTSWSETAKGPVDTAAITAEADLAPPWPDSAARVDEAPPLLAQADRTSEQDTHQLDTEAQPASSTKSAFARVDVLSLEEELKALEGLGELNLPLLELEPEPVKTKLEAQAAESPGVEQLPRVPQASPRPDMEAKPSSEHAFEPIPEPVAKPAAAIPTPTPTPEPGPQAPPRARVSRPAEPSAEAQAKQELVRVRADRLDQMVNSAGEISIFRARIEQQSGIIGFNLEELNQTLYRLRNQLRRLEIETEAQIQFRFDQVREEGTAPDASFDPLEMDRFSSMQQVSRALTETLDDLINLKDVMVETNRTTDTLLLQQSRVNNDLQDSLLRTRMVSFSQAVPRLQRLVRQTAQGLGKKGELQVEGGGGELDRSILDRILAPLEHILRNALSHGIETPDERRQQGKNETGRIVLSLLREGKDMLVRVEDDGAGINIKAIRKKAIERGLLEPDAQVTEDELIQFLLESGFSTASQVTQVSGRGVGMDVVVSEVKQLGGVLDISSNPGKGTRFDIRLPFTLSLTETLLVGVGDDIFAVPHTSIEGVIRMSREQLEACYLGVQEGVSYAGNAYRVRYLAELLGFVETGANFFPEERKWYPMLLVRHGELRIAIHADRMLGSRQIVVKSVGAQLSAVRWITGGTILADGRVALILDVTTLVRLSIRSQARILRPGEDSYLPVPRVEVAPTLKATVMVVDDSVTVRKVTGRLLSRHNLNVVTAKDGVDALDQLQNLTPDVMLLDIEMPRMDGYELTRHIRHDTKLKRIPIIMITSRTGDKHRQMAMDLGVNLYLGKPFQEAELLESIRSLLPEEFQEALN